MPTPFLSLIIPAFNEEKRLPDTLQQVHDFISRQNYSAEMLVVENGSTDNTFMIAEQFASSHKNMSVLHLEERGKGIAVRTGMLASTGEYRMMLDADLSMPVDQINRFIPPSLDSDIAIASREAPGAVRYNEPNYRHVGGRLVNTMIRVMSLPGLQDTQCGFKCFRGAVAEELFSKQTLTGWAFDIEVLYIARLRGYSIVEIPIPWYYRRQSRLNPLQDAFRMFLDILKIRANAKKGIYA
ncbi:MAG: dolichyl-phosphate beta-glucosyltransferase [Anaerolineales bacterium]